MKEYKKNFGRKFGQNEHPISEFLKSCLHARGCQDLVYLSSKREKQSYLFVRTNFGQKKITFLSNYCRHCVCLTASGAILFLSNYDKPAPWHVQETWHPLYPSHWTHPWSQTLGQVRPRDELSVSITIVCHQLDAGGMCNTITGHCPSTVGVFCPVELIGSSPRGRARLIQV